MTPGRTIAFDVPADRAYGAHDPARVRPVSRSRFNAGLVLVAGRRVRMQGSRGRPRVVRVVEVRDEVVLVDANHPRCGQSVVVEIELVSILTDTREPGHRAP